MKTWKNVKKNQTAISEEEVSLIDALSFLQAQRIKRGVSQGELAKRLHMSQSQLAKIENLDVLLTPTMVSKYASGLKLDTNPSAHSMINRIFEEDIDLIDALKDL